MKTLLSYHYVLCEEIVNKSFMIFQIKKGDLLIQSSKIVGFFKEKNTRENSLIFYRAVSIITTDPQEFDLRESDGFENDNDESDDNDSVSTYFS